MGNKRFEKKLEKMRERGERAKAKAEIMDEYAQYMPPKKERKVSNIMLGAIVVAIIGYTVAAFALQFITGNEISSTLTAAWFSAWTVELCALATIKITKTKNTSEIEYDVETDCDVEIEYEDESVIE